MTSAGSVVTYRLSQSDPQCIDSERPQTNTPSNLECVLGFGFSAGLRLQEPKSDICGVAMNLSHCSSWGATILVLVLIQPTAHCLSKRTSEKGCALSVVYESVGRLGHPCPENEVRDRARKGGAFEQNQLGLAALIPSSGSLAEALHWFSEAAKLNYAPAEVNLGLLYLHGWGTEPNYALAMHYFQLAADQGSPEADYNLGVIYLLGRGVKQDNAKALKLFLSSASNKNPPAENAVGYMYDHGLAVEQNEETAVRWYREAAEAGYPEAQTNLAQMYFHGTGVPRDEARAFYWFRESAIRGNGEASVNLGFMYAKGWGTTRNVESAYFWLTAASLAGFHEQDSLMDALGKELSPQQIKKSQAEAERLTAKTRIVELLQ